LQSVKCSYNLFRDIEKNGGKAIMWKTGHSLIKEKMKGGEGELFGAEMSGISSSPTVFRFDDAILCLLPARELLSIPIDIIQLLDDVPKTVITPEIRVDCPDEIKFSGG